MFFIDHAVCQVPSSQRSAGNIARFEVSYF